MTHTVFLRCPCGVDWNQGYLNDAFQLQTTQQYPVSDGLYGPLLSLSLADTTPAGCSNLSSSYDSESAQRLRLAASLSALEDMSYSLDAKLDYVQGVHEKVSPVLSPISRTPPLHVFAEVDLLTSTADQTSQQTAHSLYVFTEPFLVLCTRFHRHGTASRAKARVQKTAWRMV